MPLYTYACKSCEAEIERRQSFSDAPLTTCESCGGELRRVLHPVGVIFKGSGFYNTDYKRTGNGSKDAKEPAKDGEAKDGKPKTEAAATKSDNSSSSTSTSTKASTATGDKS